MAAGNLFSPKIPQKRKESQLTYEINHRSLSSFILNIQDVERLIEIHRVLTGDARGRRRNVEVLNKSAVVLLTACLEAFIEDLAEESFDFLLSTATTPDAIPDSVRTLASKPLAESKDERKVWELAGDGWKDVLANHRSFVIARYIEGFNTPKPDKVDKLFKELIGLNSLSSCWHWRKMSHQSASDYLTKLVEDRGSIAHRTRANQRINKDYVTGYRDFVYRVAACSYNSVRTHLLNLTGKEPWTEYTGS